MGWEPIGFSPEANVIILRSNICKLEVDSKIGDDVISCSSCLRLQGSSELRKIMERATGKTASHTPWDFLTVQQMKDILADNAKTMKRQLSDFQRILMLLAKNDIPGLRRLLAGGLKHGASPRVLVDLLERAVKGLRTAKGFSERDYDIALIAKALGGPRLLYALQKAYGLPSQTTLRNHQRIPTMLTSVGVLTKDEVKANIQTFFQPDVKPPSKDPRVGNTLMFDGIALEAQCSYCPKRDKVLGLCREHSHRVNTSVEGLEAIETIREFLNEPKGSPKKVCFACEATIVAIAPYADSNYYTPIPIVSSPSDKTEKGEELVEWIKMVIKAWKEHPQGEKLHGPLWTIGSDGDSSYRLAKHIYTILEGESVQGKELAGNVLALLEGLNLLMSKDGVVGTCDPKHIFKRFATLLRSAFGFLVDDTNIKPEDVCASLSRLPGVTEETAQSLLDPVDKQNVPKAVALIQHLQKLESVVSGNRPGESNRHRVLCFVGEFFNLFMQPFIDVSMDLSGQVEMLSTFAHVASALYLRNGTSFLTGALYSDCQAVVKSIMFTIARLQAIDPELAFHIIHEGTDRLENLFGDVRTQDHARNVDAKQVGEKLSVAALLNAAFARQSDLDRGHRRLKVNDSFGVDHLNPQSWKGDVRVGQVDLPLQWANGRIKAIEMLQNYFSRDPTIVPDFLERFKAGNCDLLRPRGDYVGVQATDDDERSDRREDDEDEDEDSDGEEEANEREINEEGITHSVMELEGVEMEDDDEVGNDIASSWDGEGEAGEEMEADSLDLGADLEDCLPEHTGNPPSDDIEEIFQKTIMVEGKSYLKSSVVATLSSKFSKKLTNRLLRVQGLTLEDFRKQREARRRCLDDSNVDDSQLIKSGDLAAILVDTERQDTRFSLAVIEMTGFKEGDKGSILSSIHRQKLVSPKLKVFGQILGLNDVDVGGEQTWEWSGSYLRLGAKRAKTANTSVHSRRQFVLQVPGLLVHPLSDPMIVTNEVSNPSGKRSLDITWRISNRELRAIQEDAWMSLGPNNEGIMGNINLLPHVTNPSFPYRSSQNSPCFVVSNIPPSLTASGTSSGRARPRNALVKCFRLDNDDIDTSAVAADQPEPCGFCGQGGSECLTQLVKKGKKFQISSTCTYRHASLVYEDTKHFSPDNICTNVPIVCTLCPSSSPHGGVRTIWKYNALYHFIKEHSDAEMDLPFLLSMFIHKAEEEAMGIEPEATEGHRLEYDIPDSDGLDADVQMR
ncbi:hypothetical protein BKA70DRAFT_1502864, partial [Coprinopsis sp. MPI-PUGE-AT-0042]